MAQPWLHVLLSSVRCMSCISNITSFICSDVRENWIRAKWERLEFKVKHNDLVGLNATNSTAGVTFSKSGFLVKSSGKDNVRVQSIPFR